jgi:transposase InsO family protein
VNVYPFIEAEKAQRHNVIRACQLLEVSRSAYYAHRAGPSQRARQDAELTDWIVRVHEVSAGTYGAPRVHAELRAQGHRHSRKRIARLMRQAGRRGRTPKRWRTTTIPDPAPLRPDLVTRDFRVTPGRVNARWCGDITYINTWEGWLYLATVIDLASRRVVGWATADHLRTDLVAQALTNAVAARRPTGPVIFHSDRGCQGGLKWSSQCLVGEVERWAIRSGRRMFASIGVRFRHRGARRWLGVRTGSGSGRRSLAARRPRTLVLRRACRGRLGSGGSATLAV